MPECAPTTECVGPVAESSNSGLLPDSRNAEDVRKDVWCRKDYYCLAGLCGLIFLVYAQLWIPGLVLIKRDAFQFFLPIKQYIIDRLSAGEIPQWFPYEGLGRPLVGIPVTGVFHPFTALYWLFPVYDAYRVSTLLSCLMGAAGTYILGRTLRLSSAGAFAAAIGFSCSGYVVSLTENIVYLYSTCALPVFLLTLEKVLMTREMLWHSLSALVWASILLNGDVQTGYYVGFIALVWVGMRARMPRAQAVGRVALIAGLAILVASVQLAPAWVTFSQSNRTEATSFHVEATHWSTHPLRLFTLAVSPIGDDAEGDRIATSLFGNDGRGRGPGGFWAESLYLGLPMLGLAIVGSWARRDLRVFALLGGVGLLLALGKYGGLYELFYHSVPLWSAFRYPEKLMGLVSFSFAMLAGGGFDVIREGRTPSLPWFGVGILCLGLGALLAIEPSWARFSDVFGIPQDLAQHITATVGKSALFSAATALGIGVLMVWMRIKPTQCVWASTAVVVLILIDLARANLPVLYTASSDAWTFTPGLAEAMKNDARVEGLGHFRVLSIKDARAEVSEQVRLALTPRERIAIIRRHGLYVEHNATFHIESVQSYLPGNSLASQQIGRNANIRSLARYNVAYLIGRPARFDQPQFAGSTVASVPDYDLALVRNPVPVTPRAYLSKRPEALSSVAPILSFLDREDFLRGEVDGIEGVSLPLPGPLREGYATILEYRPETVRVAVKTSQSAVLVLADVFEPGWEAKIDGRDVVPIFRANGLVRAVVVPPGQFEVLFNYETPMLRAGGGLSLVGITISLFLILKGWARTRVYPTFVRGVSENAQSHSLNPRSQR